jgi:Family of unknown function (DUF5690)
MSNQSTVPSTANPMRQWTWAVIAAFGTYFCMYAFRKPFTAGSFEVDAFWGLTYKTILVISQVLGYTISKFIGIKIVSEMPPTGRAKMILLLIAIAECSLIFFGMIPAPYNFICLFLNGLPLGMVFGFVLGFLEGRRATEALTAGLCASFIVADGVSKSVGEALLREGISEFWMPAVAGSLFVLPLLIFVWMLTKIAQPDDRDIEHRGERVPMYQSDRRAFFRKYGFGLCALTIMYLLITILRTLRADFQPEIWKGLGYQVDSAAYARSELLVAIGVILVNGSCVFIRNNRFAFRFALGISLLGTLIVIGTLLGREQGLLSPFEFMVLIGLGLYIPYVAVHATIFERLMAMTRERGNIGYLMYLVDAFGYLGYVAVMVIKNVGVDKSNFLDFFLVLSWWIAILSMLSIVACFLFFRKVNNGQLIEEKQSNQSVSRV